MHAGTDLGDQASRATRRAKLFMNIGLPFAVPALFAHGPRPRLTEQLGPDNLNFTGGKIGDQVHVALTEDQASSSSARCRRT